MLDTGFAGAPERAQGEFSVDYPRAFCLADKFREYIPASKLQGAYLWDEMVEQQKKSLIREIIS